MYLLRKLVQEIQTHRLTITSESSTTKVHIDDNFCDESSKSKWTPWNYVKDTASIFLKEEDCGTCNETNKAVYINYVTFNYFHNLQTLNQQRIIFVTGNTVKEKDIVVIHSLRIC